MRTNFGSTAVAALLGLLSAMPAGAATGPAVYYVDSKYTGAAENGTASEPFKTLANAFDGSPTLRDGDEIRVGTGTYTLTGNINFPDLSGATTGVMLKGGYPGFDGTSFDATSADPMARPVTVNVGSYVFNLDNKSVVDGLRIRNQASSGYAIVFGFYDAGGVVRRSDIEVPYNVFDVAGDHSLIEDNTIVQTSGCYDVVRISGSSQATVQRNTFTTYDCGNVVNLGYDSRAVFRLNAVNSLGGGYVASGEGYLHAYQNQVAGRTDDHSGTAFYPDEQDHAWIVNNNNISHFYWAFKASEDEMDTPYRQNVDDGGYRIFDFRDNHVFLNGYDTAGMFYMEDYPISTFRATGNCFDAGTGTAFGYLYGNDGYYFYPLNLKELEEVVPENFSGNIQSTATITDPKAPGCGNKGVVTTTLSTKPIARPYAYDATESIHTPEIAVHPGEPFTLSGDQSVNFEGGPLSFTWTQVSGPKTLTLDSQDAYNEVVTGFTMTPGKYVFRLVARAGEASNVASDAADITVWVMAPVVVTRANGTERGRYKYLQAAVFAAQAGDTITLPAGMFLVNEYDDGSNTYNSVEIYGKSDLIIQGQGSGADRTLIGNRNWDETFDVQYSRNITLRNMDFFDPGSQGYDSISTYGVNNLVLDNVGMDGRLTQVDEVYFLNTDYTSLTLRNSTIRYIYEPVDINSSGQVIIENNLFEANDDYTLEIDLEEDNDWLIVRNNTFNAKTVGEALLQINQVDGHTGYDASGIGVLIEGNKFTNHYYEAIEVADVAYSGALIQDNVIYTDRRWTGTGDYGILIGDAQATVKNNVIYNTYYDGVRNDYGMVHVEGNVIAFSDDYGIYNDSYDCSTECTYYATARNNILYNNTDGAYYQVDVLDGNAYVDPKFVNPNGGDFTPAAGSPLFEMPGIGVKVPPAPPGDLQGEALAGAARLIFAAVDGATGYKLYWGESSGAFSQSRDLGLEQVALVEGLAAMPYYFAVTARNAYGESAKSAAVVVTPAPAAVSAQSQPAVEGVNPTRIAYKSAADIEITGADFREGAKVFIGSTEIEVLEVSEGVIKAKSTADVQPGMHPVVVVNADLGRGSLAQALNVTRNAGGDGEGGCASNGQGAAGMVWVLLPVLALLRRRMQD